MSSRVSAALLPVAAALRSYFRRRRGTPQCDVVVKLGGSAVTKKASFETLADSNLADAASAVAAGGKRCVVVHGAGSFGHFQAREFGVSKGKVIFQDFTMTKEYELSFEAQNLGTSGWSNILAIFNEMNDDYGSEYGSRNPMVSMWPQEEKVQITSAVSGYYQFYNLNRAVISQDRWTKFTIKQTLNASGHYMWGVMIPDDSVDYSTENSQPISLPNAKLYASHPDIDAAPAKVRNISLLVKKEGKPMTGVKSLY